MMSEKASNYKHRISTSIPFISTSAKPSISKRRVIGILTIHSLCSIIASTFISDQTSSNAFKKTPFVSGYTTVNSIRIWQPTFQRFSKPISSSTTNYLPLHSSYSTTQQSKCKKATVDDHSIMQGNDPLSSMGLPSPLILGSGSFTRKLILTEMNIPFELRVRSIDEKALGDRSDGCDPSVLVMTLAKAKSEALVQSLLKTYNRDKNINDNNDGDCDDEGDVLSLPESTNNENGAIKGWIVLTADQVVTNRCNGGEGRRILEKPDSLKQAKEFVSTYGHNPPSTVGAVVLTHIPSLIQVSGIHKATIKFASNVSENDCELIDRLVEDNAPVLSCAGGLMVEHPFVKDYIENIDGTEDSVMGLSKELVLELLGELKEKISNEVCGNNQ